MDAGEGDIDVDEYDDADDEKAEVVEETDTAPPLQLLERRLIQAGGNGLESSPYFRANSLSFEENTLLLQSRKEIHLPKNDDDFDVSDSLTYFAETN